MSHCVFVVGRYYRSICENVIVCIMNGALVSDDCTSVHFLILRIWMHVERVKIFHSSNSLLCGTKQRLPSFIIYVYWCASLVLSLNKWTRNCYRPLKTWCVLFQRLFVQTTPDWWLWCWQVMFAAQVRRRHLHRELHQHYWCGL